MTEEEKAQKIKEIYAEANEKLKKLFAEREHIIREYIKELEEGKIDAIRASLELSFNKE